MQRADRSAYHRYAVLQTQDACGKKCGESPSVDPACARLAQPERADCEVGLFVEIRHISIPDLPDRE